MSVDLRTEINDCDNDATTFTTSGGALGTITLTGEFYEGTGAVEAQHSNTDDELYTTTDSAGTALNIDLSDATTYIMLKDSLVNTYVNGGVQILLGDGTNRIGYDVGGNDAKGLAFGPFFNTYKLDVSEIVANPGTNFTTFAGTEANLTQTAVSSFGVGTLHNAKAVGNVSNLRLDRMTYHANGSYGLRINGGTAGTPETMADVQADDVTNGWGMISNPVGDQYQFIAPTEWGEPAANADAYFSANNEQWYWIGDNAGGRAVGETHFPFRVVGNATDTISFVLDNVVIVNTGTRSAFDLSDSNVNIQQLNGVTFTNLGTITGPPASAGNKYFRNCIFNTCDLIDFDSVEVSNCTFNGTISTLGTITWPLDDSNISDLVFNAGDGAGSPLGGSPASEHAIYLGPELLTGSPVGVGSPGEGVAELDFTRISFNGYGGNETEGAAVWNNTGGEVTINVINGDTPTVLNSDGSVTIINNAVTVSVTVEDVNGNPIRNARVAVYPENDSTAGSEILLAYTNALGIATTSYNFTGDIDIIVRVRKSSSNESPPGRYVPAIVGGTITTNGFSVLVRMIEDTNVI